MLFKELFINITANASATQDHSAGSMPAGHNGPYHDPETPVRNTAHWLITYLKAFELSGESRFKIAAEKCVQYLTDDGSPRKNHTYLMRHKEGKDTVTFGSKAKGHMVPVSKSKTSHS